MVAPGADSIRDGRVCSRTIELRDYTGWTRARQLARNDDLALRVDGVNLKRVLRQIEPNPRDSREIPDRLAHGRLPFRWVDDNDHLGTMMPFGAPSTVTVVRHLLFAERRTANLLALR
jgi:hypothetical protein